LLGGKLLAKRRHYLKSSRRLLRNGRADEQISGFDEAVLSLDGGKHCGPGPRRSKAASFLMYVAFKRVHMDDTDMHDFKVIQRSLHVQFDAWSWSRSSTLSIRRD
jgi:hypothetical protein